MEKKKDVNKHEILITIEGEKWHKALQDAYKKKSKKIKMDGFRPGKVPYEMYVKRNGIFDIYIDASNLVIEDAYDQAIQKEKVQPAIQPLVDIQDVSEDKITLKFTIITAPEVNIKKYKDLKIKSEKVKVTKEEIEHEIEHLLEHYAELVIKDGKIENGDTVILDYEGFKDGVPFEGGKALNYSLEIGSNTFIPGFEEGLIGLEKDAEKDLELTFPEDYHVEELKGQKVIFKVKVHEVKTKKNRELDEEFFEDLGMEGVNSKETLEASIKDHIETHKKVDAENKFVDDLMDAISKNTEVDIPEEMVQEEVERLVKRVEENLNHQGISLELYYEFSKTTEEDLRNNLEPEAFKNVMYRLILDKVMELEKIEVTDSEVDAEIEKMMKEYKAERDEIVAELGGLEMIKYDIKVHKTFDKLKEYNEVK